MSPIDDEPQGLRLEWKRGLPVVLLAIIVIVLSVLLWAGLGGSSSHRPPSTARTGYAAPDFELTSLDGERVALSDYIGSPVVLNLWASWCTTCAEEFSLLAAARDRYRQTGLEVLGVAHDDEPRRLREFATENGATWPLLLDPNDDVWVAYEAIGLPTSYFIDVDGVIQAIAFGTLDEELLRDRLASIGVASMPGS